MDINQQRKDKIAHRFRQIRETANALSLKKLLKLDYGDRALIEGMLDKIHEDLHRVRVIADSGCSQLIELLEHMGGDVSPEP